MNQKKIIIASPHFWDTPYRVGSHQYAKCFSDNNYRVAYVSVPITPFHIAYHLLSSNRDKVFLSPKWHSWTNGGKQLGNIWTYVPFGLIPMANKFIFNSPWAIKNTGKALIPPLKNKFREKGFDKVDIIWLDSPLFGYLLEMVPHRKSVLRVADDISGFPELGKNVIDAEKGLAKIVDIVIVTSRTLESKVKKNGAKKILYLPNGVEFDHFAKNKSAEPQDIMTIPKPRIIYVGAIERWFDERLITYAASRRKDLSFVIIGAFKKGTFPELENLNNVFFLGPRDYEQIPLYLKNCNVGIIPFKRLPFINSVNPIKLYEYMACGLPVVSTRWQTLEEMASPALLADTKEEFLQHISTALAFNDEIKEECVQYAYQNSWNSRLEFLNNYL